MAKKIHPKSRLLLIRSAAAALQHAAAPQRSAL